MAGKGVGIGVTAATVFEKFYGNLQSYKLTKTFNKKGDDGESLQMLSMKHFFRASCEFRQSVLEFMPSSYQFYMHFMPFSTTLSITMIFRTVGNFVMNFLLIVKC